MSVRVHHPENQITFDAVQQSTIANQSEQEGLLQWQKEAKEGYITWIINRVPFQQNLELETFLIKFYGRYDLGKGPLVNRTNGGRSPSGRTYN